MEFGLQRHFDAWTVWNKKKQKHKTRMLFRLLVTRFEAAGFFCQVIEKTRRFCPDTDSNEIF